MGAFYRAVIPTVPVAPPQLSASAAHPLGGLMFYFQRQAARKWSGRLSQLQLYSAVLGWLAGAGCTGSSAGCDAYWESAEPVQLNPHPVLFPVDN